MGGELEGAGKRGIIPAKMLRWGGLSETKGGEEKGSA